MSHARSEELIQLADNGDTAAVLAIVTLDEIAQQWCEATAESMARVDVEVERSWETGPEWRPFSFAFNCLTVELHRPFLLSLVAFAPTDDVLSAIGAGPFEDWQNAVPDECSWMSEQAARDPRFALALSHMR